MAVCDLLVCDVVDVQLSDVSDPTNAEQLLTRVRQFATGVVVLSRQTRTNYGCISNGRRTRVRVDADERRRPFVSQWMETRSMIRSVWRRTAGIFQALTVSLSRCSGTASENGRLTCPIFDFGWGFAPDPTGQHTALPRFSRWV